MPRPLILFAQWFGPWPQWIEFFVESCKWNPEVDWLIFTDQDPPENGAPNVRFETVGFEAQKATIGKKIVRDISGIPPLTLCDLKPCLGFVFSEETEGYRNFGYCDLDLIFGDIRAVYTDELLAAYEAFSTHDDRMSGHLTVLRNNAFNREAFRHIRNWRRKVVDPRQFGIDEYRFANVFRRPSLGRRLTGRRVPALFEERYTTPLSRRPWLDGSFNFPSRWYWKEGKVTAEGYEDREFMYFHFMNWKASSTRSLAPGFSRPPWSGIDQLVSIDWRRAATEGFMLSFDGIGPLPQGSFETRRAKVMRSA
jgi:Family of unknown function (DUF6625)